MGQALYRKYRSKSLGEIVGQPHITTTLTNSLKQGTISHAYLFTGPKGVGKTSIARILAHEVNGLPYDDDSMHLDIIEIDAASNRRIDEIRELRERVHTAPTSAKYKVYIIDEVHMLTKEAFNALLKTLEEPPAHAIFILATTESHKLPDTIVSRTQRFTFKPVEEQAVVDHLRHIASEESVTITDDALRLIAAHGGGSFRDSIGLLDQIRGHSDAVVLDDVQTMLGIAPDETIDQLIGSLQSGDAGSLVAALSSMREHGYQAGQTAKQLSARLRGYLLDGKSPIDVVQVTPLLHKLLEIPTSSDPATALELTLLGIVLSSPASLEPVVIAVQPVAEQPKPRPEAVKKQRVVAPLAAPVVVEPAPEPPTIIAGQPFDAEVWNTVLNTIKKTHNTLYSVSRMASPQIDGDTVTLVFKFAFHQKRLNETKNKQVIVDVLQSVTGRPISITCVVEGSAPMIAPPLVQKAATSETISNISNIFGSAEVLES